MTTMSALLERIEGATVSVEAVSRVLLAERPDFDPDELNPLGRRRSAMTDTLAEALDRAVRDAVERVGERIEAALNRNALLRAKLKEAATDELTHPSAAPAAGRASDHPHRRQQETSMDTHTEHHGLALVIADRGFVWVGDVTTSPDWVHIKDARPVRRWGTTEGLGQLAKEGPLLNTRLDAPADTKVARRALIAIIPCEASKWNA